MIVSKLRRTEVKQQNGSKQFKKVLFVFETTFAKCVICIGSSHFAKIMRKVCKLCK